MGYGAYLTPYSVDTGYTNPVEKQLGSENHSAIFGGEVRNAWFCTSTSPIPSCLLKHRDHFIFTRFAADMVMCNTVRETGEA
jgi:hypothetical protein